MGCGREVEDVGLWVAEERVMVGLRVFFLSV